MTWTLPTAFPTVPKGATIAVDTETYCEDLKGLGPQFLTGGDYPIGISLAFDGYAEYFPFQHNEGNCPLKIAQWFKALLKRRDLTVVFANARFDLEALAQAGIEVLGAILDVQVIDALLDENQQSYTLNSIALRRNFPGKASQDMELWMQNHGLVRRGTPDMGRMREVPPEYVAEYAAEDAALTLRIYHRQMDEVAAADAEDKATGARLADAVKLESDLIPVLWAMRRRGIPVDVSAAEQLNDSTKAMQDEAFKAQFPSSLDPWTPSTIVKWITGEFGLAVPQTGKAHDSVTNEWMEATGVPALAALANWRRVDKIRKDYVEGVVLQWQRGGMLHPSWFQTRGISYRNPDPQGTKTGRIAATQPNLTQIPNRNPVWSPQLRRLFVPRQGERWLKADYKTQEPRILLHYACQLELEGAEEMRQRYIANPGLDSHQLVTDMINAYRDAPLARQQVKPLNLGIPYHLGRAKLQKSVGCSLDQLEELITAYHAGVPYVKPLRDRFIQAVEARGWVKTIRGRRRRFTEWEPAGFNGGKDREKPLPEEAARAKWHMIKRAGAYRGINAVVQGSASDQMKTALVMMHAEGLEPMIQVYDEVNASVGTVAQAKRICEIMEHAIPEFTVPHVAEGGLGPNWADAKEAI